MNYIFLKPIQWWKKKVAHWKNEQAWNNQFPPLSCHPPYVSLEDLRKLQQIIDMRRQRREVLVLQTASEM